MTSARLRKCRRSSRRRSISDRRSLASIARSTVGDSPVSRISRMIVWNRVQCRGSSVRRRQRQQDRSAAHPATEWRRPPVCIRTSSAATTAQTPSLEDTHQWRRLRPRTFERLASPSVALTSPHLGERCFGRAGDHVAGRCEPRSMAGTVPCAFGCVPPHHAPHVGADRGAHRRRRRSRQS
jgi:hypothetical protein